MSCICESIDFNQRKGRKNGTAQERGPILDLSHTHFQESSRMSLFCCWRCHRTDAHTERATSIT
jgi:hypothetical protein